MLAKKCIMHARSSKNGIIFYSNSFPLICSKTFRDSSGQIHSIVIPGELVDYIGTVNGEKRKLKNWHVFAVLTTFDILLISFCLLIKNFFLVALSIYFSLFVSFDFFNLILSSYLMKSKNGSLVSLAKFHSAEHMAVNAYEQLQRIPTLGEIKCFSRFSSKCGFMPIVGRIVTHLSVIILLLFAIGGNMSAYYFALAIIPTFMVLAWRKGWFEFLQVLVTTPPTDSELEVAIEGLKNFEEMEKALNKKISFSQMLRLSSEQFSLYEEE